MTVFKIGHRGAMAMEPENTLRSFKKAVGLGVDYVELDIRLSEDEELMVFHDEFLDRTTDGEGPVRSHTREDLQKLDAGKGEQISTLEEVLKELKGQVKFVIELKEDHQEDKVVALLKEMKLVDDAIIISFVHRRLVKVRELCKDLQTGVLLVADPLHPSNLAKDAEADFLFSAHAFTDKEMVDEIHAAGLRVVVWTVLARTDLKKMLELGVDGIAVNDPRLFVEGR
ncbi:MAG: hypothetical protein GXP63_01465 [DPANN group archaeon]|nr:hypothetical protein [DPANN group archaeon]